LAVLLGIFASGAMAEGAGVAAKAGLLGFGVEYSQPVGKNFALRLGANAFTYDYDGTEGGVDYDLELELSSFALLLDWHPMGGSFRLTLGGLANGNGIAAVSREVANIQIGDVVFAGDQVGTLRGDVEVDSVSPYLGLGWDWSRGGSGIGAYLDLGVLSQGTPVATLTADGPLAGSPIFQQELAKELAEFNAAIEDFELFPVVALGIVYRF
jgi:hypothetical protein